MTCASARGTSVRAFNAQFTDTDVIRGHDPGDCDPPERRVLQLVLPLGEEPRFPRGHEEAIRFNQAHEGR